MEGQSLPPKKRIFRKFICFLILVPLIFFILFYTNVTAQADESNWVKEFGGTDWDGGRQVQQTSDGGFIIAGTTSSFGEGSTDGYLIKVDSVGELEWQKNIGGNDSDWFLSVQQTGDGGFIIGGVNPVPPSPYGGYLVKTDANGNVQWEKNYLAAGLERVESAFQRIDGYLLFGRSSSRKVLCIKTDTFGNIEWQKDIIHNESATYENIMSVEKTTNNGYILVVDSRAFIDSIDLDLCIVYKIDSTGEIEWKKVLSEESERLIIGSARQTSDEGYILGGSLDDEGFVLIKTDEYGVVEWRKTYGSGYSFFQGVVQALDGGFVAAGYANSDPNLIFLYKTDASGNKRWVRIFGGEIEYQAEYLIRTQTGNYIIVGNTDNGHTTSNVLLMGVSDLQIDRATKIVFAVTPNPAYIGQSVVIQGNLTDEYGEPLAGMNVSLSLNGTFLDNLLTNSTGGFYAVETPVTPGEYEITLAFDGSEGLGLKPSASVQTLNLYSKIITSITVSTSSSTTYVGFTVDINGTLQDMYGNALKGETVVLYSTFAGIETWTPINSDITDNLGGYHITWIPSSTGYFKLMAEWMGNATHCGANITSTLSSVAFENQYVFSIESNSTISALAFDSERNILSFNASGPDGTSGYTKVTMAKKLIGDIAATQIFLDGNQLEYSVTSLQDSWLLNFTYQHSSHTIAINLSGTSSLFGLSVIDFLIIGIVIAIICAVAVFFVCRRRRMKKS